MKCNEYSILPFFEQWDMLKQWRSSRPEADVRNPVISWSKAMKWCFQGFSCCSRIEWVYWISWTNVVILERWKSLLPRRSSAELYGSIPAVAVTLRWIATVWNFWYAGITWSLLWFWILIRYNYRYPSAWIIDYQLPSRAGVFFDTSALMRKNSTKSLPFSTSWLNSIPSWTRLIRINGLTLSLEVSDSPQSQGITSWLRNRVHIVLCNYFSSVSIRMMLICFFFWYRWICFHNGNHCLQIQRQSVDWILRRLSHSATFVETIGFWIETLFRVKTAEKARPIGKQNGSHWSSPCQIGVLDSLLGCETRQLGRYKSWRGTCLLHCLPRCGWDHCIVRLPTNVETESWQGVLWDYKWLDFHCRFIWPFFTLATSIFISLTCWNAIEWPKSAYSLRRCSKREFSGGGDFTCLFS